MIRVCRDSKLIKRENLCEKVVETLSSHSLNETYRLEGIAAVKLSLYNTCIPSSSCGSFIITRFSEGKPRNRPTLSNSLIRMRPIPSAFPDDRHKSVTFQRVWRYFDTDQVHWLSPKSRYRRRGAKNMLSSSGCAMTISARGDVFVVDMGVREVVVLYASSI
ncbi:unnamed protein product [Albugo candida]|uniref:Uncharacterized protein n=1 Tax=Albugo candida TaxID=65357 RepID=A0A024GSK5_9STRA|nr:unnamed protein product [Albugo candida]|eukprot:CCI49897.1 unnamed protein product [Albugo candida]